MLTEANNSFQTNAQVSKEVSSFSIHLVGDPQVGKTSIMDRYLEDLFQETLSRTSKAKTYRSERGFKIEDDIISPFCMSSSNA